MVPGLMHCGNGIHMKGYFGGKKKKLYQSVQQQQKQTSFNKKLNLPDVLILITESH